MERESLKSFLEKNGIKKRFAELFGIQTQVMDGPFAHDVEAVLERMASGKLKGTQLLWD